MRITVKAVLISATLSITALSTLAGGMALFSLRQTSQQLAAITEHTLPAMRLAGEMQSHLAHFRLAEAMTLIALDQETKVTAA
ncbi:MAG: hypothetical protein P4L82_02825, partial [Ancalomicrobiaceae bacterium]|nr:hypothetical protein [Ancalomicrobiaceae bacterium]